MMSLRPAVRSLVVVQRRSLATKKPAAAAAAVKPPADDDDDAPTFSPVELKTKEMQKSDPYMVFGDTSDLPAPVLPENPAEISALDPAQARHSVMPDGTKRMVHIRQGFSSPMQSPRNKENYWVISFQDEGETANAWINPLMGWVSGADPMASHMHSQMSFPTAADAVYFCTKRGWDFVVDPPKLRRVRGDDVQYQDNFLPQAVAEHVHRERTNCKHWERPRACTSHYMRPLSYHGDAVCSQHGPNPDQEIVKHVEGVYKMR